MNYRIRILQILGLAIMLFISNNQARSQYYQFSQFYSSPILLAPSFTGLTDGSRVAINYRDQWPSLPGTFLTYALAYDHYFTRMRSGFGLVMLRDVAGPGKLALTNIGLAYSYDFNINRTWHVRPGIHFMYSQRSLEFNQLILGDQMALDNDNLAPTIEVPPRDDVGYIDAASSVLLYSEKHWVGLNVEHLMRPNQSLKFEIAKVPMKFSFFGGTKVNLGGRKSINEESLTFSFLYKAYERYDQLDLGLYYTNSPLVLGAWFRGIPVFGIRSPYKYDNIDAVIVLIGYKLPRLNIGYSYDFTVSRLMNHTGGSHEISIVYEFNRSLRFDRHRKMAAVACPNF